MQRPNKNEVANMEIPNVNQPMIVATLDAGLSPGLSRKEKSSLSHLSEIRSNERPTSVLQVSRLNVPRSVGQILRRARLKLSHQLRIAMFRCLTFGLNRWCRRGRGYQRARTRRLF